MITDGSDQPDQEDQPFPDEGPADPDPTSLTGQECDPDRDQKETSSSQLGQRILRSRRTRWVLLEYWNIPDSVPPPTDPPSPLLAASLSQTNSQTNLSGDEEREESPEAYRDAQGQTNPAQSPVTDSVDESRSPSSDTTVRPDPTGNPCEEGPSPAGDTHINPQPRAVFCDVTATPGITVHVSPGAVAGPSRATRSTWNRPGPGILGIGCVNPSAPTIWSPWPADYARIIAIEHERRRRELQAHQDCMSEAQGLNESDDEKYFPGDCK